jgi:hypothetical protein
VLTLDDLRQIPGVSLLADPADPSLPEADFLQFEIRTFAVEGGESVPLALEVRCPLNRGRPLLGSPVVRVQRRGGGNPPRHWTGAGLEASLERLAEMERARRVRTDRQRQLDDERRRQRERAEAVAGALRQAASQFLEGAGESSPLRLPDFLRLCGEAFLDAQPAQSRPEAPGKLLKFPTPSPTAALNHG